ncbi:MAG: zinc-dependent alcohol dehydrogenase family protein [Rhodospirillaceae bacterium]
MKTKAAVIYELGAAKPYANSRPVKVEEVDLDGPRENEVLVKMAAAGVCHSDLSVVAGVRERPLPIVLGHEASGVVEEVGPGVTDLAPGDHIVFAFLPSCGKCQPCREGRPSLCEPGAAANGAGSLLGGGMRLSKNGQKLYHQAGVSCFAEYAVSHRSSVIKIDKNLPLDVACTFSCAVITGVGAILNTAKVPPGSSVGVVGLGGTGLAAVMGAKMAGARHIVGIDALDDKLDWGKKLGCDEVFNALDNNVVEKVRDATGGGLEYMFECVGKVEAMELAYRVTKRGGTTTSSGLSHPATNFSVQHVNLVTEERTIKGSYLGSCVPERDIPHYIDLYKRGALPVDKLICERIPLEQINEAFDHLDEGHTVRQVIEF